MSSGFHYIDNHLSGNGLVCSQILGLILLAYQVPNQLVNCNHGLEVLFCTDVVSSRVI